MAWEVEYTNEFEEWWDALTVEEQRRTEAAVEVLQERGPGLGRPWVDTLQGSRHPNMKELRPAAGTYGFCSRSTLAELRSCSSVETRPASGQAGTSRQSPRPTNCTTNTCAKYVTKNPSREPEDQEIP